MILRPELLAPAGDLSKLKTAVDYGADAVYTGGEMFSLRTACDNFSYRDMEKGVAYAKDNGVKVYLACNCFARNHDIILLPDYIKNMAKTGIDACIVSDFGTFSVIKEAVPDMKIHISTQASTSNFAACNQWYKLGAQRIILSRELSLDEIAQIRRNIPSGLELEAFVHGAICVSHSGRCLLSDYMTGRGANRGDCAHACRWNYSLMEQTRPGEYMPVIETDTGTFIMNSKDLNMIRNIPALMMAGINSFKIEGRVKSEYYVASIVSAYRRAIDDCLESIDKYEGNLESYYEDTCKVSHREYYQGFYFGDPHEEGQQYGSSSYVRDWEVCAEIVGYDPIKRLTLCRQKNKIFSGEFLETLSPRRQSVKFTAEKLWNENGERIDSTPHAHMLFYADVPMVLPAGSYLRKQV